MAVNQNYQAEVGVKFNDTKLNKQLKSLSGKTVTLNVKVQGGLGNLNKALKDTNKLLSESKGLLGQVGTASKNLDKNVKGLESSTGKLSKNMENTSKASKNTADAFNHTANHGKTLSQLFTDITKKVSAFGLVTQAILLMKQAMVGAVNISVQYDQALTDFTKVSDLSGKALDNYTKKLGEMGAEVFRTKKEMIESATIFKQGGFDENVSANLAKIGEMYRNVADSAVSSADSASFIISQIKAFKIEAKDAITIIDQVNEVSNQFAVSSTDISNALRANSSSMASYGNTMSESIGLITAGTEIMTGKAVQISNGIKSVGAELVKLANGSGKLEYSVGGVTKSIGLLDEQTGDLKSTFSILGEIASSWNDMSKAEQSAVTLMLGKKTQYATLSAILQNYDSAIEANIKALDSSGSAMKENARQAESISSKFKALQSQIELLVLGDGGLSKFIKLILDTGTALVKFANSDIGGTTLAIASLFTLVKTAPAIMSAFTATTLGAKLAIDATLVSSLGLRSGIALLTTTMMANPLFMGIAIVGTIFAVTTAMDKLSESSDDLIQKTNELKTETENLQKLWDALNSKSDRTDIEERKLKLLKAQIDANKLLIQQESEKAYKAYQREQTTGEVKAGIKTGILTGGAGLAKSAQAENIDTETASVENQIKAYDKLNSTQAKTLDQQNNIEAKKAEIISSLASEIEKLEEYKSQGVEISEADEERLSKMYDIAGAYIDQKDSSDEAIEAQKSEIENLNVLAEALGISSEKLQENASLMGLSASEYAEYATAQEQIQNAMDTTNESIDGLQSALGTAQQAWKEYADGGSLTLDTFQSLLAISPEYLSALINENGQISVNQESLSGLVEQLKIAKIEELQNAAASDILALANDNAGKMSDTAKGAIAKLGDNISDTGDNASTATGKMLGFTASVLSAVNATSGKALGDMGGEDFQAQTRAILDEYRNLGNQISSIAVDTSKNVASGQKKSAGGAKKSAKSTTDAYKEEYQKQLDDLDHKLSMEEISEKEYYDSLQALNEKYFGVASGQHEKYLDEYQKNQEKIYKWQKKQQEELLKQQKQTYDKAIDYIKSNLQKKADLLKKDKEDELEDIDERIDYMEKRRDKEIDRIEDKIDTLKEEKETFVDGIEAQIDALDKLKDKEEEEWDARITAFKEQNQLLKEQTDLQKLQEALARAKSTQKRIFKDGKFVYGEDESGISEAQQNLDDYYTELKQQKELDALESARDSALKLYQEQINSLKEYKETMSKQYDEQIDELEERREQIQEYYDSRIEDMKEYREEVEEEYDAQIEILDNYIQNFDDMVNEFDEKQNKLALIQVAGAEAEKDTWMMRLENLRDFVNEYNRLQEELDNGSTDNEVEYSPRDSGDSHSPSMSDSKGNRNSSDPIWDIIGNANGDSSIASDSVRMIGDNPTQRELVIGGKLNGSLMKLSKGDGVVNAKSTSTLAGILNSLPTGGFKNYSESNKTGSSSNSLLIDKLYVQADNAMQFMDSMSREFKTRFKQGSFEPI